MTHKAVLNSLFSLLILYMFAGCSHFQQQTNYTKIQSKITKSKLDKVNKYTNRTPYHKIYTFELNTLQENPYVLAFYISESSFSKSIIKHRNKSDLHRDAIRIDNSKSTLIKLDKNLPDAEGIIWQQVANHISEEEARDSYYILQEFIRLKIREL